MLGDGEFFAAFFGGLSRGFGGGGVGEEGCGEEEQGDQESGSHGGFVGGEGGDCKSDWDE